MAYEFQDKTSDAVYRGDQLEFLLDDDTNIGEVYLDGDLIFQADEVFSEEQLRQEFREEIEIIEAQPDMEETDSIDEAETDFMLEENELSMTDVERGDLQERLFTKGGEYAVEDDMGHLREFIGDYHIHPKQGAMVGKFHNMEPHALLVELGFEELKRIRLEGREPIQIIDYAVDEIIDPEIDDILSGGSNVLDDDDPIISDNDRSDFY
tara:strand:+ start:312 stop:938 length:627 start_codon:yes stop_codon:yes gene_type:complete